MFTIGLEFSLMLIHTLKDFLIRNGSHNNHFDCAIIACSQVRLPNAKLHITFCKLTAAANLCRKDTFASSAI